MWMLVHQKRTIQLPMMEFKSTKNITYPIISRFSTPPANSMYTLYTTVCTSTLYNRGNWFSKIRNWHIAWIMSWWVPYNKFVIVCWFLKCYFAMGKMTLDSHCPNLNCFILLFKGTVSWDFRPFFRLDSTWATNEPAKTVLKILRFRGKIRS